MQFALECSIIGMPTRIFDMIVEHDTPGQSNNPKLTTAENEERARLVRSFEIPAELKIAGSRGASSPALRTTNIAVAFRSSDWTWTASDFLRLANFHVISRDRVWQESDFHHSSLVCNTAMLQMIAANINTDMQSYPILWNYFGGGPDWVDEENSCLEKLDGWRDSVVEGYNDWLKKMNVWRLEEAHFAERLRKWEEKERKANEKASTFILDEYFSYSK
jgi:hypothetical protein